MARIPKKVLDRFSSSIKSFQAIAQQQKERDVSEADTVTIIKDMLAGVFGYDKYQELTGEYQVRGTFCDLAIKVGGKLHFLIEVKSIGSQLNDNHIRQAVDYGSKQGVNWVVLTNAIEWRLYRINFGQPVSHEEITAFNFLEISHKKEDDQQRLFLLCREGITSDAIDEFHQQVQSLNKYTIAEVIQSEPVVSTIRRELKKLFPETKAAPEQIIDIIRSDVLRRDVMEGDKAEETQKKLKKCVRRLEREAQKRETIKAKEDGLNNCPESKD